MAKSAYTRFYNHPWVVRAITSQFHRLYYQAPDPVRAWHDTYWLGTRVLKCPLDLWNYQEIVHAQRPDLVVECGTAAGGSALFFASLFDLIGHGRVLSIDIGANPERPAHPRISYLLGSSTDPAVIEQARAAASACERVMVVLDSDHRRDHVLGELRAYGPLVTPGSFLIVEDTNLNGHPVAPGFGPGPMEAVRAFLAEQDDFVRDARDRKFFMTFNPEGFLRRRAAGDRL